MKAGRLKEKVRGGSVAPAAYAVKGMPTSYLLDAQGRVIAVEEGFHDDNRVELEERIRAAVAR